VVSPQAEKENGTNQWVFKEWSNGARNYDVYTATRANVPETLTARFVPAVPVSFLTSPTGLKLTIDGNQVYPIYNYVWGLGLTYNVSAPLQQTDSHGRRYIFKSWSDG